MRVVIQRVSKADVKVGQIEVSKIGKGLLILVGFEHNDSKEDINWLHTKIVQLRIFDDEQGRMNKSILETGMDILLISQFTLYASTKKGNRPSYAKAAPAAYAEELYTYFTGQLEKRLGKKIYTGIFGANMQVSLVNDGPVTIVMDTKNKE